MTSERGTSVGEVQAFLLASVAEYFSDVPCAEGVHDWDGESSLVDDLGLDSVDLAVLIHAAERRFRVELRSPGSVVGIATIRDLARVLYEAATVSDL